MASGNYTTNKRRDPEEQITPVGIPTRPVVQPDSVIRRANIPMRPMSTAIRRANIPTGHPRRVIDEFAPHPITDFFRRRAIDEFAPYPITDFFERNLFPLRFVACGMILVVLLIASVQIFTLLSISGTIALIVNQIISIVPYIKALDSDPSIDFTLKLLGGLASFVAIIPLFKSFKKKK